MSIWLSKSLLAMLSLVPLILVMGLFGRQFGTKPESMVVFWFVGTIIGVTAWLVKTNQAAELSPTIPLLIILAMGAIFGTIANLYMFQSIIIAPNPGLPVAVVNTSSLIAFLVAPALAWLLPRYFTQTAFHPYQLIGTALTVVGISLIASRQ